MMIEEKLLSLGLSPVDFKKNEIKKLEELSENDAALVKRIDELSAHYGKITLHCDAVIDKKKAVCLSVVNECMAHFREFERSLPVSDSFFSKKLGKPEAERQKRELYNIISKVDKIHRSFCAALSDLSRFLNSCEESAGQLILLRRELRLVEIAASIAGSANTEATASLARRADETSLELQKEKKYLALIFMTLSDFSEKILPDFIKRSKTAICDKESDSELIKCATAFYLKCDTLVKKTNEIKK